jgi:hypothetical protein
MPEQINIQDWPAIKQITMQVKRTDDNPNMPDMPAGSNHYKCTLRFRTRRMIVIFSQGPAIDHEPTLIDVLDCLASDAAGVENGVSFEDWCADYGYDTDSRKAERIYKACEREAEKLRNLLGDNLYQELLWNVKRS